MSNIGWVGLVTVIYTMGGYRGGLCRFIAGCMEWKKGKTFVPWALPPLGFFGFSGFFRFLWPRCGGWAGPPLALYFLLFLCGGFDHFPYFRASRSDKALRILFGAWWFFFWVLGSTDIQGGRILGTITGYEEIICGLSAIYAEAAQVLNEVHGKVVLPLGPVKK